MGRQRRRLRQQFLFFLAGIALLLLTACVSSPTPCPDVSRHSHLAGVRRLVDVGDFDEALRRTQEIFDRDPHAPGADALLFDLALLNAHPGNSKKDNRKALSLLHRFMKDYTESPLAAEAKIWIGILESIEKSKQVDIEIEEKKKGIIK